MDTILLLFLKLFKALLWLISLIISMRTLCVSYPIFMKLYLTLWTYLLQLRLNLFSFFAASVLALARFLVSDDKLLTDIVEKYILEQLNLTKDSISEVKVLNNCTIFLMLIAEILLQFWRYWRSISCTLYCTDTLMQRTIV